MKILTLTSLLLVLMALSQAIDSPVAVAESETKETPAEAANDQPETEETLPEGSPDVNNKTENNQTASEVNSDLAKRYGYCPNDWCEHKGRFLRFFPKPRRWAQAETNCVSMGANLASVHNMEEYHFIQNMIRRATHSYQEAWIGGSDGEEHGVWFWSDGSAFHYTNWCRGEPSKGQHCLQINYGHGKCWDNAECHVYLPFVCAKKV